MYPLLVQIFGSREVLDDGTVVDRATSGRPRFRSYFATLQRRFLVIHELDNTDRDTLMTFYNANQYVAFTFTWDADGVTYTCKFAGAPQLEPIEGIRNKVTVNLIVTG